MEKKITKKQVYGALINMVEGMDKVGEIPADAVVAVLEKSIEQIDKKAAKAAETRAKKAIENDEFLEVVFGLVTDEPQTGDQIAEQIEDESITVAKVRARLTKLVNAERIVKEPIKVEGPDGKMLKKMAYSLPSGDAEDAE